MKYRVYASNDGVSQFHRIEAKCDSFALDNAMEYFEKCVRELKFFNVWLISDFEKATKQKKSMFKKEKPVPYFTEDSDDMFFFPISEYHFDTAYKDGHQNTSAKDCVRHDLVELDQGIKIMFTDNLEAMEQMEWAIENRVLSKFTFDNKMNKSILGEDVTVDIRRTILDTKAYLNREKSEMNGYNFIDVDTNYIIPKKIDKKFCNFNLRGEEFIPASRRKKMEDDISAVVG